MYSTCTLYSNNPIHLLKIFVEKGGYSCVGDWKYRPECMHCASVSIRTRLLSAPPVCTICTVLPHTISHWKTANFWLLFTCTIFLTADFTDYHLAPTIETCYTLTILKEAQVISPQKFPTNSFFAVRFPKEPCAHVAPLYYLVWCGPLLLSSATQHGIRN